jgi:hypothetical protein
MNRYYWESVGECVNQVYAIEADNWEAAKKIAFADMKAGDILAECPPRWRITSRRSSVLPYTPTINKKAAG